MIKVKAIDNARIRIDGVKQDVKKGTVVEIEEERLGFFVSNWFVRAEDVLGKWDLQTTDWSRKATRGVKKASSKK